MDRTSSQDTVSPLEGFGAAPRTRRSFLGGTAVVAAAATLPALAFPAAAKAATSAGAAGSATAATAAATDLAPARRRAGGDITVGAGQTYVVQRTTRVNAVTIASGGTIAAPAGYSLSMTVNGIETGGVLTETGGTDTVIAPGAYRGDIVLTVAAANPVPWQGLTFPFRQALYVDATGVVPALSVLAAVAGGRLTRTGADGVRIVSSGQDFDGVYVSDGTYMLDRPDISLTGDGRCDFIGYGAAVVGTGSNTRLVVDGARISNHGAVRTGVIATNGSTVIVKNSTIRTRNGVLPADYQPTVDLTYMESAPWMLAISGNVRATNLLGDNSTAAYINSSIASETWGALSTDSGSDCRLLAVNSVIANTGPNGYGSYVIGDATEWFLGCRFDVGTYATINTGGSAFYDDSTPQAVAQFNELLGLGLTVRELAALPARPTIIDSRRFGVMWHGAGTLDVRGGTVINSPQTTFLNKAQQIAVTVDGSGGARLNPGNGIILQLMENDDPGPVVVDGNLVNQGVYTEPTGEPDRVDGFDVTIVNSGDATAVFTDIDLAGDFYNGIRGGAVTGAGPGGPGSPGGQNMVLTFERCHVEGVISATLTRHAVDTITSANYEQLGAISNTVQPVVNNGVIVALTEGSRWTVTGTSYQSSLTLAADASVTAPRGRAVSMTVDGAATPIVPGNTYSGAIVLTVHG